MCFSVGSNQIAENRSHDLILASSVFTIHFVFVQREDLLFRFAIFCLQIYSFIQFIFICFLFLFHSNLNYFLPLATSFYYVPAEIAEEKVTILIVDCGVQLFLLKTSSSLVDFPYLGIKMSLIQPLPPATKP